MAPRDLKSLLEHTEKWKSLLEDMEKCRDKVYVAVDTADPVRDCLETAFDFTFALDQLQYHIALYCRSKGVARRFIRVALVPLCYARNGPCYCASECQPCAFEEDLYQD